MNDQITIPDQPWIPLEVAQEAIICSGLIAVSLVEHKGKTYLSGDTSIAVSNFLQSAAFAGKIRMMGVPTGPHDDVPAGPFQEIPLTYFFKPRSFYGDVGIGRLSFEPSPSEISSDNVSREKGFSEGDWIQVFVCRSDLLAAIDPAGTIPKSGAPGRPSSMEAIKTEFRRRCETRQVIRGNLTGEAKHLAEWLKKTYPAWPKASAEAIRNALRAEYRERNLRVHEIENRA